MWTVEETQSTSADPAAVWERWVDPERWVEHNEDLEWARLDGPLTVGSRITLKTRGGPKSTAMITRLQLLRTFTTVGKLPGCRLTLDHELDTRNGRTVFTHRLTMHGVTTPLFRRLFGNDLAARLPAMLASIARLAEAR